MCAQRFVHLIETNTFHCSAIFVHLFPGLLDKEPLKEVDEDMVSEVDLNNTVTEEEREEIENELIKVFSPVF